VANSLRMLGQPCEKSLKHCIFKGLATGRFVPVTALRCLGHELRDKSVSYAIVFFSASGPVKRIVSVGWPEVDSGATYLGVKNVLAEKIGN
jgi:hypothetical protein